jgi:hypothetical protein
MIMNRDDNPDARGRASAGEDGQPTYRSVAQDMALSLAGDIFGLLLERCNLLVGLSPPHPIG